MQRRCAGMDGNFFPSIEARGTDFPLDGKSVFLRGISIQEEASTRTGRVWSEEDERTLLGWAKELVCKIVRLAQLTQNEAIDAGPGPNGTVGLGIRTKRSFRRTILGNEDVGLLLARNRRRREWHANASCCKITVSLVSSPVAQW